MKTVQLSFLGLLVLIFFACQKDIKPTAASDSGVSAQFKIASTHQGGPATPVLTPTTLGALPVNVPVTVTYTATDPDTDANLECGRVFIHMWNGTDWSEVASGISPTATYTFTPSIVGSCAYKFRASFASGGGSGGTNCSGSYTGVDVSSQTDFCLNVVQSCVQTFTIGSNVTAEDKGNGLYEFTVTYTLTSPVAVTGVKFQGGATAGGNTGHEITYMGGKLQEANTNNNNTVLKWEGNLTACVAEVIMFKYTRNFSCPATSAQVTGAWSATQGTTLLGEIAALEYTCN